MTDKKTEALKLALEALEFIPESGSMLGSQAETKRLQAITAIREALAEQPAKDEFKAAYIEAMVASNEAGFAGMSAAETIRELSRMVAEQPAQQDEIDWKDQYEKQKRRAEMWVAKYETDIGPLEKAVPVTAQQQEPVAYDKTEINCFAQDLYDQKMREGKHGHYESMFHVIHQCIKKVSPQPSKPLTDEQIGMAFRKAFPVGGVVFTNGAIDFARAIEAKLREKNNG